MLAEFRHAIALHNYIKTISGNLCIIILLLIIILRFNGSFIYTYIHIWLQPQLVGPKKAKFFKINPQFYSQKWPTITATKSWRSLLYFRFRLSQLLCLYLFVSPCSCWIMTSWSLKTGHHMRLYIYIYIYIFFFFFWGGGQSRSPTTKRSFKVSAEGIVDAENSRAASCCYEPTIDHRDPTGAWTAKPMGSAQAWEQGSFHRVPLLFGWTKDDGLGRRHAKGGTPKGRIP